jgi:hypothetical protein
MRNNFTYMATCCIRQSSVRKLLVVQILNLHILSNQMIL